MTKPILSIIMPVFNGAQFIQHSLASILKQITSEVEIVVVDDGSKDDTVGIINQQFQHFINTKQLIVYSGVNRGVSAARNIGLENAKGNFIGFMDADDLALPIYLETILEAISHNVDIVEFGFKRFTNNFEETIDCCAHYTNNLFGKHLINDVIDHVYSTARWYPWTRVFKKELFFNIRFPLGVRFCEDLMTIPKVYENAHTILVLKDTIYGYRSNINSATFEVKPEYISHLLSFYGVIPKSDEIRNKYLRLSVAYAIVSCQMKLGNQLKLPDHIQKDLYKLRLIWPIYVNIETRRVLMLIFPKIYLALQCLMKLFRS